MAAVPIAAASTSCTAPTSSPHSGSIQGRYQVGGAVSHIHRIDTRKRKLTLVSPPPPPKFGKAQRRVFKKAIQRIGCADLLIRGEVLLVSSFVIQPRLPVRGANSAGHFLRPWLTVENKLLVMPTAAADEAFVQSRSAQSFANNNGIDFLVRPQWLRFACRSSTGFGSRASRIRRQI
jgi:hypothetical protein